jgi:hypothetical protein
MLGCMPYQSYHTVDRALANASRFMQETLCDAVKPQGGKSQAHILKAHCLAVHDHHVHGRRDGAAVAVRDHRQAVAQNGDVDAGHLRNRTPQATPRRGMFTPRSE